MSMSSSKSIVASGARVSPATQVCWIPDGETRLDREFARTTSAVAAVLNARRSRRPPSWETLLEAAVRDAEYACDVESRYLRGEPTRVLNDRGTRRLREQAGEHGFVESRLDADGVEREYLVQHVGPRRRAAELRISWYGLAPPVGPRGAVPLAGDRTRTPSPRVLRDAQRILALLTREFGRCGENPVRVTLPELRLLLGCDADRRRGPKRAMAALRALQELRFEITHLAGPKRRSYGALIGTITERAAGRGRSVDGDVYVQLGTNVIGCLDAFAAPRPADHPRSTHDFGLRPSSVGASGFDILPTSCLPHYAVAAAMTEAEAAACEWIDRQLTLTSDARSQGRRARRGSERELREYSHADCELLPRDHRFVAAYGHFARNPERGYSLLGTRADGNGLVDALLRPWHARGRGRREGRDITDTVRLLRARG